MIGIKEKYLMQSNEFFYHSFYSVSCGFIVWQWFYIQSSFTVGKKSVEKCLQNKMNLWKSIKILQLKILIKNSRAFF